jgi:hypothetical protein
VGAQGAGATALCGLNNHISELHAGGGPPWGATSGVAARCVPPRRLRVAKPSETGGGPDSSLRRRCIQSRRVFGPYQREPGAGGCRHGGARARSPQRESVTDRGRRPQTVDGVERGTPVAERRRALEKGRPPTGVPRRVSPKQKPRRVARLGVFSAIRPRTVDTGGLLHPTCHKNINLCAWEVGGALRHLSTDDRHRRPSAPCAPNHCEQGRWGFRPVSQLGAW